MEKIILNKSKNESEINAFSIIAKFNETTYQDIQNLKNIIEKNSLIEDSEKIFENLDPAKKQKMAFVYYKLSDKEISFVLENTVPGFSDHHNFESILSELSIFTADDKYNQLIRESSRSKKFVNPVKQDLKI